jgi:hypothetical protein
MAAYLDAATSPLQLLPPAAYSQALSAEALKDALREAAAAVRLQQLAMELRQHAATALRAAAAAAPLPTTAAAIAAKLSRAQLGAAAAPQQRAFKPPAELAAAAAAVESQLEAAEKRAWGLLLSRLVLPAATPHGAYQQFVCKAQEVLLKEGVQTDRIARVGVAAVLPTMLGRSQSATMAGERLQLLVGRFAWFTGARDSANGAALQHVCRAWWSVLVGCAAGVHLPPAASEQLCPCGEARPMASTCLSPSFMHSVAWCGLAAPTQCGGCW